MGSNDAEAETAEAANGAGWPGLDVQMTYVLPVELVYRELAQPKPPETRPALEEVNQAELTRADVDKIIRRTRTATPEELQEIIARARDFKLTSGERNQLSVDLTIAMAQRARQLKDVREDPNSKFIHDLGYALTPFGLLAERTRFQDELQAGAKAIAACRRHSPPHCPCWKDARASLYSVRESYGVRSPESWAALRVWEALEEIELSARPGQ